MTKSKSHSKARSAARLAAVQALYQMEMEGTPLRQLLVEFHHHRLGGEVEGEQLIDAEVGFFDAVVAGVDACAEEIDALIVGKLATGWSLERLDKPMKAILRAGTWELIARADIPKAAAISEYVDVAKAFYEAREAGFINGVLDAIAKDVRG